MDHSVIKNHILRSDYLNNTHYNCTMFLTFNRFQLRVKYLIEFSAPIFWFLGVSGNVLGFIVAFSEKPYPRVILTRSFYGVNIINCLLMILYPILDLIGEFNRAPFWEGTVWKHYLADYHFPIAKSLINLSLGIYVLFSLSQMFATMYPHVYRKYFTTTNIIVLIVTNYLYVQLWFFPARWWFLAVEVKNICGFIHSKPIYIRVFTTHQKRETEGWIAYGFLREIFTKLIPILSIIIFKLLLLKKKKTIMHRVNRYRLANTLPQIMSTEGNIKPGERNFRDLIIDQKVKVQVIKTTESLIENQTDRYTQKLKDFNMDLRTLAIITLQCIFFLLPTTIFLVTLDFYAAGTSANIEIGFIICTLLEYLYVALTFYLNIIFNPEYRHRVGMTMKDFWNKIEKKMSNRITPMMK
ncbi:unnamed protein product [Gordionus sp. m RMFG-2023]